MQIYKTKAEEAVVLGAKLDEKIMQQRKEDQKMGCCFYLLIIIVVLLLVAAVGFLALSRMRVSDGNNTTEGTATRNKTEF